MHENNVYKNTNAVPLVITVSIVIIMILDRH